MQEAPGCWEPVFGTLKKYWWKMKLDLTYAQCPSSLYSTSVGLHEREQHSASCSQIKPSSAPSNALKNGRERKRFGEISRRRGVIPLRFCKLGQYVTVCLDPVSGLLLPVPYYSSFCSERACLRNPLPTLFHLEKPLGFGADDSCTRRGRRANT